MKKIFAFAMAIVSMAAVMTSCSNDEADFVAQQAPGATTTQTNNNETSSERKSVTIVDVEPEDIKVPEFDGKLYFAAFPDQNEYINSEYTVEVGGKSVDFNLEELPVATTLPEVIEIHLQRCERQKDYVRPTIYVYEIPADMNGKVNVITKLSVKEGVELPASFNVVGGASANTKPAFCYRSRQTPKMMPSAISEINNTNLLGEVTK